MMARLEVHLDADGGGLFGIETDVDAWQDGAWPMTAEAYASAMEALRLGASQLQPDGDNCAVCGDSGHQAFECRHNPLVMARRALQRETEYRCFHCGDVFTSDAGAREHFGSSQHEISACLARTDPETITAIVDAIREEEDDEQAEVMVRHLLRGTGCEEEDEPDAD